MGREPHIGSGTRIIVAEINSLIQKVIHDVLKEEKHIIKWCVSLIHKKCRKYSKRTYSKCLSVVTSGITSIFPTFPPGLSVASDSSAMNTYNF